MNGATATWLEQARSNAGWLIVLGVLEIIVGILAMASPAVGGVTVAVLIGIMFLIGGIIRLLGSFLADSFGAGALSFLWGLIVAVTGYYMIVYPGVTLVTLTVVLSVVFFFGGLTQIVIAFHMKPITGWGWMLLAGIIGVVLAIMIWRQFPLSGFWTVGILVGASLLVNGAVTIAVGSAARKVTA